MASDFLFWGTPSSASVARLLLEHQPFLVLVGGFCASMIFFSSILRVFVALGTTVLPSLQGFNSPTVQRLFLVPSRTYFVSEELRDAHAENNVAVSFMPFRLPFRAGRENASQVQARGEFEEAEGYFTRALDIGRRMYGPSHPNVATGLSNLAGLLRCQGETRRPMYPPRCKMTRLNLGPRTHLCQLNVLVRSSFPWSYNWCVFVIIEYFVHME